MKPRLVMNEDKKAPMPEIDYKVLNQICDRAFYQALMMIHKANHRPKPDSGEPKVGGHASACASSQHILAAIHLVLRQPEDYLACKPHVSPMDHAFNLLLENFKDKDGSWMPLEKRKIAMRNLRHYSKEGEPVFQSYHAESDPDSWRIFPSGSVGIPPVQALYLELAYELAKTHGFKFDEEPYFWSLMGDSEFREGSLAEAMPDGGDRQLKNQIWIVDYNRQSLDGTRITNEAALGRTDAERIIEIAEANGWNGVKLQHGKKREEVFAKPGGDEFKRVLEEDFTDFEFQSLLGANDASLTKKVLSKKSSKLSSFLKDFSDQEVHDLYFNLAGHDLQSLVEAFTQAKQSSKPTLIVAYTIKGNRLECAAKSGNHSTLPSEKELEGMAKRIGADFNDPFENFEASSKERKFLDKRGKVVREGRDRLESSINSRRESFLKQARQMEWPTSFNINALKLSPWANTQWMWGQVAAKLDRLVEKATIRSSDSALEIKASGEDPWEAIAPFFLTMAPDVGTSTNTSPNMNGKLFGEIQQEDFETTFGNKDKKAPDVVPQIAARSGHLRFEIAEGNCMSAAGSFGKFGYFVGIPFFPAMTIYDFFIKRCHDQFYYNLYWKSQFATIGTPAGVTLAPEGAQHSWKSDFQIPHCLTWEPTFAQEVDWILADSLKRNFQMDIEGRESILLRCVTKGLPQKEFLKKLKTQKRFENMADDQVLETTRIDVLKGAYKWIHYAGYEDYRPGDNVVELFAMGALAMEAAKASDALREKGIYANVYVVTCPDLLLGIPAHENDYEHLKQGLGINGNLHLNPNRSHELANQGDWYSVQASRVPIVSVHDGEAGLLDNLGSVVGVKQEALAVRKTSKSGNTESIYKFHGLDPDSIVSASEKVLTQTAKESFQVDRDLLDSVSSKQ